MFIRYNDFIKENNEIPDDIFGKYKPEDFDITSYGITKDGVLDIHDLGYDTTKIPYDKTLDFSSKGFEDFPFKMGRWCTCNVDISHNKLSNLNNAPKNIGCSFNCSYNKITSLEGSNIEYIGGDFDCSNNLLTSLDGIPDSLSGNIICFNNLLKGPESYPILRINFKKDYDIKADPDIQPIFDAIKYTVLNNVQYFFEEDQYLNKVKPQLLDKVKFHRMVMLINPSLIKYYTQIKPNKAASLLF